MSDERNIEIRLSDFRKENIRGILLFLIGKFTFIFFFLLFLNGVMGMDRLPRMLDQDTYLRDIENVQEDITFAFLPDSYYTSPNTLYSRMAGIISWCFSFLGEPLVGALILNLLAHYLIAYYSQKIYTCISESKDAIIFYALNLSPTLWAYSFFALRDLLITLALVLFFYSMFRKNYLLLFLVMASFIMLRRYYIGYVGIFFILFQITGVYYNARRFRLPLIILGGFLLVGIMYLILQELNFFWMFNIFGKRFFTAERYFLSIVGLNTFFVDEDLGYTSEAGRTARLFMLDSMIIPLLNLLAILYLVLKGKIREKQISITMFVYILTHAFTYFAISSSHNFPFRKLLPILPMMYIVVTLAIIRYRDLHQTDRNRTVRFS